MHCTLVMIFSNLVIFSTNSNNKKKMFCSYKLFLHRAIILTMFSCYFACGILLMVLFIPVFRSINPYIIDNCSNFRCFEKSIQEHIADIGVFIGLCKNLFRIRNNDLRAYQRSTQTIKQETQSRNCEDSRK